MIAGRWFLLVFTLVFSLRAQDPFVFSSVWRATFDSDGSDVAEAIAVDGQGNLLIAGQTADAETLQDGLVIKVNASGQRVWARRFDSTISQNDQFTDVAVDSSGNAAVVGLAADRDAITALLVASYAAANGSNRWLKLFPGPHFTRPVVGVDGSGNVYARTAVEDGSGQIIRTYKFSPTGTALWTNEISAPRDLAFGFDTRPNLLVQADGSSFLGTLKTSGAGDLDWSVVKLRPDGTQQWQLAIGGTNYEAQPLIAFHSSGDLLIAGSSQNDNGTLDILIQRLSADTGARVWQTKLRGSSSFKAGSHILNDLNSDAGGNVWLAGRSPTWGGFVSRFDSFGNFNWITHFTTDAKKIVPLSAGQGFLAMDSGLAWFDDNGALLKFEVNRYGPVVAVDSNHNVYAANSFYKAEAGGDFGLEAEKLIVDRSALAPKFTSIPQFNTGSPLQNVMLAPEVSGSDLVFTWYHNGILIPGQTNRVLSINTVDATTIGFYSLSAQNSSGASLTPDIEVLTVTPIFIRQPRSQTFAYGGDVAFSALAVGFEPQLDVSSILTVDLTYQWFFNGLAIPGETQSKLLIRKADENWIGRYKVRATVFYRDLNLFFFQDSDEVTLDWPFEGIEEDWRDQFYLTDEPWSRPNGMEIKSNGDLWLSLQSPYKQFRADIANHNVLSFAVENFRPTSSQTPKGPHFTDSQGNFYTIGETNLVDTSIDWMVSKHSATGTSLWQQSVSSLGRQVDNVADAVITPNDDIVVTGWSNTAVTGRDAFTVCLNKADGSIRWSAVFDDPAGVRVPFSGETPSGIAIDKNGNTFVAGTGYWLSAPFHFLVSYDSNGAQRFVYERGWSTSTDTPPRLAMDPDGNVVMAGTFGIIKVDSTGRELFVSDLRTTLTAPPPVIYGMQVDHSGNIYLSGNASGSGEFAKFDAFGHLQAQTLFTGTFPDAYFDPSARFSVDDYGNTYLSGTGGNIFSEKDIVGVKLDPFFNRLWMVRVDGIAQNLDSALDMKVQGNDVYLVGSTLVDNTMAASVTKFTQTALIYLVKDVTTSKTIKRGTRLHLEAQATGNPPFFQWYKDNQPIPGAWAAAVDLPNVTSANEGFYALRVYDSFGGNAFDAGFAIRVADPAAITTQPVSTNVIVNGQIALSAAASGSAPLFYQWQVNGVAIANATNATITIDHAQFSDRGDYKLVVSNAWGLATSFVATVKVLAPANLPPIVKITEPADRLVQRDNTVVHLRAAAYDADGRVTQVVFRVNGATAAVIGVAPFDAAWTPPGPGIYKVTVTATDNLGASTTSGEVEVVIAPAPIFTKQPPTLLPIAENSDITLEAEATSAPPPRYQWRLNGANIPGATNRTYTISGAQARNSGRYAALAINEGAATISSKAEVIVDAPSLTLADQFAAAVEVTDIQFTGRGNNRNATKEPGEPNHAGQRGGRSVWLRWRAPASGVVSMNTRGSAIDTLLAVYTGTSVTALFQIEAHLPSDDERGGFHCSAVRFNAEKGVVYDIAIDGFNGQSGNIVLSWVLDASSRPLPIITSDPRSLSSGLNGVAAFHVDAFGSGLSYQWFLNGYPVPGATNSGLVLPSVTQKNLGNYVVRVTNADGSVESQVAELELGNGNEPVTQDRVEDLLPNTAGAPKGALAASFAGYPTISPGVPYRKFFNTAGATADDNEPVLGDGGGASKWFLINAGGNGTLVADTIGSDFSNVITLHDPSNFDTLPVLANGVPLPGGASRVTYPATNGLSYLIRVDGVDQAEGNVVLNVTIGSEPAVTSGSLDQVIAAGQSATLNATVTASPVATFQWYLNDNLLPGATAPALQVINFDPAQVGAYALEAKNALGSVKKTIAYLEIARPVVFSASATQGNGSITMQLEGNNRTYWIDITQDFINWINIFSVRTDNGALIYTDTPAANQPLGFYRARWQ